MRARIQFATMVLMITSSWALAQPAEYSRGHADLGILFDSSADPAESLSLAWEIDGGGIVAGNMLADDTLFDPADAYARLFDASHTRLTLPIAVPELGLAAGDTAWVLSQNNIPQQCYLGFAAEQQDPSEWTDIEPGTRSFQVRLIDMVYTGAGEPGNFGLWQTNFFGGFSFFFSTADGIAAQDVVRVSPGGHDHYNWAFTKQGVYELTFEITGMHASLGLQQGESTVMFIVGDATAVPSVDATAPALVGVASRKVH